MRYAKDTITKIQTSNNTQTSKFNNQTACFGDWNLKFIWLLFLVSWLF